MLFTVRSESEGEWPATKTRAASRFRRLVLLSNGPELMDQLCELDLNGDHASVKPGSVVEVRVKKITSVFQGNARLTGEFVEKK
jgi:hypothetical protein